MLEELQKNFRLAIQQGDASTGILPAIVDDGAIAPEQRLQVYQNNFLLTLADNLQAVFLLTENFVGEIFLREAIKQFIRKQPPKEAALDEYGAEFADFFENYEHAEDVIYIADIIRIEWAIHRLQYVSPVTATAGKFVLNPHVRIIESDYPLLNLWMVGQGQLMPEAVHLEQGGQTVCVVLDGGEIKLYPLTTEEMALLKTIENDLEDVTVNASMVGLDALTLKGVVLAGEP